jgi:hypothetical protein
MSGGLMSMSFDMAAPIADIAHFTSEIDGMAAYIALGLAHECLHNMNLPAPQGMPVVTGTMQRGHDTRTSGTDAAEVYCSVYYWFYVVFGHRTRSGASHSTSSPTYMGKRVGVSFVSGNDYPQRALDLMVTSGAYDKIVKNAGDKFIKGGGGGSNSSNS